MLGMDTHSQHSRIVDELGGTVAVARLCEISPASVSEWRQKGIPRARLMFLRLARPDVFERLPELADKDAV